MRRTGPRWREPFEHELLQLVLYDKPKDYPECQVVRAWYIAGGLPAPVPSPYARLFDRRISALLWIRTTYPELNFMPRRDEDEPQIVGVWL